MKDSTPTTEDTLFHGDLSCRQHRDGYRFSIDSVLLAHFATVRKDDKILDLGAGCGVISLILYYRHKSILDSVTAVELQKNLAELAKANVIANGFSDKVKVTQCDVANIRQHFSAEQYSVVVSNPPFYHPSSGRKTDNEEARVARHQISASLDDFLRAAFFLLKNRGAAYFIYPAEQIIQFSNSASVLKLAIKKIRFVYGCKGTTNTSSLALIKCIKNGGIDTEILPPLYVYERQNGEFTREVEGYFQKNSKLPL